MTLKQTHRSILMALALTLFSLSFAQAQSVETQPASPDCSKLPTHEERIDCAYTNAQTKTIYLKNITNQNDANEIMVAIRNTTDPGLKIYLLASQNALVVSSYPQELAKVEALIQDLDRPKKSFRLTYTITELDAGKTIGTEHYSMVVVAGQRTSMKEGDKIPVATGSYTSDSAPASGAQTQFTYLDIGMNFDSTVDDVANGVYLKSKIEQSSLGQPSTIAGVTEPVVRQTVLEGLSFLPPNKPVMLGSIDVPNSTRHFDIAVVLEAVK